jgi:hypothetical protein
MPDQEGFILAHYAGMRERHHPAYTRMFEHFGPQALHNPRREN